MTCSADAQIQQAWVARYNNGITNGTNQAVKMVLDSSGNVYVTGFSQNANSNLGYVTIKYGPSGTQLWAARYDSTNSPMATPAGLVLDNSNNVIVTGTALTVKYDVNGNQVWTAPYPGAALAVDTNGNVGVTGFGTSFGTVKLSPAGSNLWSQTYASSCGQGVGQAIVADTSGNYYVAGSYPYFCDEGASYYELLIIKYSGNGNQLWNAYYNQGSFTSVRVGGVALDGNGDLYLVGNFPGNVSDITFKYALNGSLIWTSFPDNGTGPANGLALDSSTNVLLAGQDLYAVGFYGPYNYYCTLFKLNSSGATVWANHYPQPPFGQSAANSVAVDSIGSIYITGYSSGTNTNNDVVTIKYGPNGNQVWLQFYGSQGSGNAAGNAIAVDKNGNVYVAGYDTTAAGGTEMVLIKYSPVTLQRKPDGTVLLEAQGSPGESFDIEASIDLLNWLDLGTVLADTNGLMMFDDTNAPNFPARFYYTNPQ
jgi:Beta-propeller repeat